MVGLVGVSLSVTPDGYTEIRSVVALCWSSGSFGWSGCSPLGAGHSGKKWKNISFSTISWSLLLLAAYVSETYRFWEEES